ncbi:SDH family Clp fold serine proteinase [Thermus sediminis]|uniref:SDH family Clp fold serine proteinase n=1 Tax=Thermus sediminis TaxID=1761908 RepID=UPI001E3FC567|nr:hypothetical protein [Thermus sediminis]
MLGWRGGGRLGQYPAASLPKVLEKRPIQEIDGQTPILADVVEKALKQVKATVKNPLKKPMPEERAEEAAGLLSWGTWTHDCPLAWPGPGGSRTRRCASRSRGPWASTASPKVAGPASRTRPSPTAKGRVPEAVRCSPSTT